VFVVLSRENVEDSRFAGFVRTESVALRRGLLGRVCTRICTRTERRVAESVLDVRLVAASNLRQNGAATYACKRPHVRSVKWREARWFGLPVT
jgi:hypothetical protein